MKIKLAILECDEYYLKRLVSTFSIKYSEKLEIYSFTDKDIALKNVVEKRLDILIVNEKIAIDAKEIPEHCGFAYFVESLGIESLNDQPAICKFQKADLIYKQILSIYSEKASTLTGFSADDGSCKTIAFASPCGGTGNTCMAAACAMHFARAGKKVLYLNLEAFGTSEIIFHGEGQFNMSDIIFSLKSKKTNLALKLESCVKRDYSGVYFFDSPSLALDMAELTSNEVKKLLSDIKMTGSYEYIILDLDFSLNKDCLDIMKECNHIIWIGDGSPITNDKLVKAHQALGILGKDKNSPIVKRLSVIYNKFSNKTGKAISMDEIEVIGGAPRYENAKVEEIVMRLSELQAFEKFR